MRSQRVGHDYATKHSTAKLKRQVSDTQVKDQSSIQGCTQITYTPESSSAVFACSKRRKSSKTQSFAMHWSSKASRSFLQPHRQYGCMHLTSYCRARTSDIPLCGLKYRKLEGAVPEGHRHLTLSSRKEHTLIMKQGKIFLRKVISPARLYGFLISW